MGALLCSRVSQPGRRTERCDGEMVWSWHRGADAKSAVMMIRRRRGQDSRSPGRAPITRSNRRAGKAGYWAEPVVLPRAFCCTRTAGISRYPVFPAPLLRGEEDQRTQSPGAIRRGSATSWPRCSTCSEHARLPASPSSRRRAGAGRLQPFRLGVRTASSHPIVASRTASAHARSYSSRLIHSSIVCGSFWPVPKVTVGMP